MDLSNDLISQFAKITSKDKDKNNETTVYGTVKMYDGTTCVKIDGSDLLTPVDTTTEVKDGERVTVLIKNHSAVIIGNTSDPSAGISTTDGISKNVSIVTADMGEFRKLTAENFKATNAEIMNLTAKDAQIENLVSTKASIEELDAVVANIDQLEATKANITDLNATNANINNLQANKADITDLNAINANINNLQANKANIADLNALDAEINNLSSNFATIKQLDVTNANINTLNAEVADIQTLVNGNLTSDNITSLNLTSANTTVANAFIKDAMIDSVTASKLTAGIIDTNVINIKSTDGSMLINGSVQQFKDDNGKVRIQIGKDGGGKFTFILYDETGTGVLIDERGIKSSNAIADGLIVDAKVAENANIAGNKLDIASVIMEVNNDNSTTIKSNKIYLDEQEQSLEVAFNSLKTQVETIQDVSIEGDLSSVIEQVQSNTTQINVNKSEISTLVSQNEIRKEEIKNLDDEIVEVSTDINSKYTSLQQDLSGFKTIVGETYATKKTVTDVSNNLTKNYSTTSAMNSAINQKANEITSSVSQTYATKESVTDVSNNLTNNYSTTSAMNSAINQKTNEITSSVSQTYATKESVTDVSNNLTNKLTNNYSTTSAMNTAINKKANEITDAVSQTYATKDSVTDVSNNLTNNLTKNYSTTSAMNSAINQKANEITSSVSQTYATKESVTDVSNNLTNNYSTTSAMNTAINLKANEITSSVSQTYATKESVTDVSNNLTNNYSTTSAMNTAINQKANEITSSVSKTYSTKNEFNKLNNDLTTRIQTAESKLTKDSLTTTIGDYYATESTINSYGYATTSQVNQTKDYLTATFKSSGGYNLIKNSCGYGGLRGWITNADMGYVCPSEHVKSAGLNAIIYITNTTTSEKSAYSSRFELKPNTVYTLSGYIWKNSNVSSYDVLVLQSTTAPVFNFDTQFDKSITLITSGKEGIPAYFEKTFMTDDNVISGIVRIDHNGYNNSSTINCNVHFTGLCLVEGGVAKPWSPHPSETYSASTIVDSNGVKVTHTGAAGYTLMGTSGFYLNDGSKDVLSITSSGANFNMPISANLITTGTLNASKVNVINIDAENITTGYISCNRLKGGTISAADEINFLGGARIFGNEGSYGAGLKVSAAGIELSGGTYNSLDGYWYIYNGDVEISDGNLTVAENATIGGSLTVNSTMKLQYTNLWTPTGTANRDNLKLGNMLLAYDSANTSLYVLNTAGSYIPVRASRFQATGDVVCNSVWASTKVYANNVALSSDIKLKSDIRYVNVDTQSEGDSGLISPNVLITTKDMHEFIETLPMVSYRMNNELQNESDYTYYGFIAQDILYTKVGSELIEYGETLIEEKTYDEEGRELVDYKTEECLKYSENKFIAFICGALQEEILQRKALEKEIEKLKKIVEKGNE